MDYIHGFEAPMENLHFTVNKRALAMPDAMHERKSKESNELR
jgi:hypothetical protein